MEARIQEQAAKIAAERERLAELQQEQREKVAADLASRTDTKEAQRAAQLEHAAAEQARREGRRAGALDVILRPPLRFFRMYVLQLGFLDGAHGLVLCALAAAQVFLKYAEVWEGNRTQRRCGSGSGSGPDSGAAPA